MLHHDCFIMMGMGGLFVILGIVSVVMGKRGEKHYDTSAGMDVREFMESGVEAGSESLKVGGWIAIAVGLLLIVMGGAFLLWG